MCGGRRSLRVLRCEGGRYLRGPVSGEFFAIERIRRLFPNPPVGEVWIGDDAAVLGGGLLVAADVLVEGVHFRPDAPRPDVGWKAVVANVSDIAAMGGRPTHLLVTVAGPPSTDLDALYEGIAEASSAYHCPVVGGDLSTAERLSVSVTVLGTTDGERPVLRSGARPGDGVWVTGPLGSAAASDYRARPHARLDEGQRARRLGATAMIDVSDGLAADLNHIARASLVGVQLARVPLALGATEEQALGGGEDFELIFTLPAEVDGSGLGLAVGICTDDPTQLLDPAGWEHPFR